MITVTMKEWTVLTFIRAFKQKFSIAPPIQEIATGCGFASTSTASYHVKAMEDAGLLETSDRSKAARTIVLCNVAIAVAP